METTSTILSPVMVWKDFNSSLPLKESVTGDETFDNVIYSDVYFSGRETADGRVRVYGVYAKSTNMAKKSRKAGILILPDADKTVDLELVDLYVKQGYAVLMIDYRGEWEKTENYTRYPSSISYANYNKAKDLMDQVETTAKETCWYEWVAVAKYAVSFLKSRHELESIGVIGIKEGASIGWALAGTDTRIDCFIPLFGAGWRAYKGVSKYSGNELEMNDDRLRYLAGVDAHAYAQYVRCPVFYMTTTNSRRFDCDRGVDTMCRIKDDVPAYLNFAPNFSDSLDANCKLNVDLFLAKFLLGFRLEMPFEPKVSVQVENKKVTAEVDIDFSDIMRPKALSVYLAEDGPYPAYREWRTMRLVKSKIEDKKFFVSELFGNSTFINCFCVVEYKSGITVSSKIVFKKIPKINARQANLVYSSRDKTNGFAVYSMEKYALGGVFFDGANPVESLIGSNDISGVCSKYGLVTYRINPRMVNLSERSLIMFDVNVKEFTSLSVSVLAGKEEDVKEYSFVVDLHPGDIWQNVIIKCSDFKSVERRGIKDYSEILALKIDSDSKCIVNNVVVL